MNEPWYEAGLFFSCMHCGRCCRRPGIVTLPVEELKSIAELLSSSPEEFFRNYVSRSGDSLVLKDGHRGECIFYDWDNALCLIYPFRPAQCRKYPFWPSLLGTREAWERESAFCPGIGQGDFHSREWIDTVLSDQKLQASSRDFGASGGSGPQPFS
jgi:Fe-S-cluster containining protein